MRAIHLLVSLKPGGAENVAINYSIALNKIGIQSTLIGSQSDLNYESRIKEVAKIEYKLNDKIIDETDIIFIHSNKWLLLLLKYLPKLRKKRIIYIQHLNYTRKKFKLLSYLINRICTDFIRITPITKEIVETYIRIPIHFIVNFYIVKNAPSEWVNIRLQVRRELGI